MVEVVGSIPIAPTTQFLARFCAPLARRARFSRSRSRALHLGQRAVKEGSGHSTQIFISRRRARSAFLGISLPRPERKRSGWSRMPTAIRPACRTSLASGWLPAPDVLARSRGHPLRITQVFDIHERPSSPKRLDSGGGIGPLTGTTAICGERERGEARARLLEGPPGFSFGAGVYNFTSGFAETVFPEAADGIAVVRLSRTRVVERFRGTATSMNWERSNA